MSHLLLLHLLFQICASAKQSGFEGLDERMYKNENSVNERVEELMQRMERMEISWETEKADLEKKLEGKLEEISSLMSDMRAEVKKEVDNVLPNAVERGLRDLPFEMVCAHKSSEEDNS